MLKPSTLLLLLVTALVGCNSLGYGNTRSGQRANNRGYNDRRAAERSYPAWARVNDRGQTAYVVCHKNRQSKVLRTNAVRGHLNHGDRFGSCTSDRRARDSRQGNNRYRDQRRARDRRDRNRGRRSEDRRRQDNDDDDD